MWVRCYDFNTGDEIGQSLGAHNGLLLSIGEADADSLLCVSLFPLSFLACNKGHHGPVRSLAFTPSYQNYASGSEDGTIRIWSWAGLEESMANMKINGGNKDSNERAIEKK